LAGAVLLGRLPLPSGFILPEKIIVAVLRVFPVYPNYDHKNVVALWMFWVPLAIDIGWVIAPIIIGCIVAVVAKGREIATMTLGFTFLALRLVAIIVNRPGRILTRPDILLGLIAAFAIGGVIVREIRSALSRRPSPTHR
jgi:cytochrome bd-type quinol oxidase subunit 2